MKLSMESNNKIKFTLIVGTVILTVLTIFSFFVGRYPLTLSGIISGDPRQWQVFVTLRASRGIVGCIGGFVLGVAGFVFQTVFRNPLASPDIIGVSSGASAGAAFGILFLSGSMAVTASAFAGALGSVVLALMLASLTAGQDGRGIVLAGIAVEFPNFAYEGGGWSQNGAEMPQEFLDALVPGSVIEISYESEDGTMWIVLPDAAAGWSRVANDGSAAINSSKNTCQITYEQIAAVCGEDKSTWGACLQCEAGSAWKVYSVKVGQKVARKVATPVASFDGFSCEGGAWGQNGFDIPENVLDALVPGTALQIDFESEDGSMCVIECTIVIVHGMC